MRRILSILLALAFGLGPVAFAIGYDEDASLPACCRRHGAHHCAMSDAAMAYVKQAQDRAPSFSAPSHCPFYPHTLGVLSVGHAFLALAPGVLDETLAPHRLPAPTAGLPRSELAPRPGRGPPALLSSESC